MCGTSTGNHSGHATNWSDKKILSISLVDFFHYNIYTNRVIPSVLIILFSVDTIVCPADMGDKLCILVCKKKILLDKNENIFRSKQRILCEIQIVCMLLLTIYLNGGVIDRPTRRVMPDKTSMICSFFLCSIDNRKRRF